MKEQQVTLSASWGFVRGSKANGHNASGFVEEWSSGSDVSAVVEILKQFPDSEITLTDIGFDVRRSGGAFLPYRLDGASAEDWLKQNGIPGTVRQKLPRPSTLEGFQEQTSGVPVKVDIQALAQELNSPATVLIGFAGTGFGVRSTTPSSGYLTRYFSTKGGSVRDWLLSVLHDVKLEVPPKRVQLSGNTTQGD